MSAQVPHPALLSSVQEAIRKEKELELERRQQAQPYSDEAAAETARAIAARYLEGYDPEVGAAVVALVALGGGQPRLLDTLQEHGDMQHVRIRPNRERTLIAVTYEQSTLPGSIFPENVLGERSRRLLRRGIAIAKRDSNKVAELLKIRFTAEELEQQENSDLFDLIEIELFDQDGVFEPPIPFLSLSIN